MILSTVTASIALAVSSLFTLRREDRAKRLDGAPDDGAGEAQVE